MDKMGIRELTEVFGKLDSTHIGAEKAIATFIVANLKVFKKDGDKVGFVTNSIQAYAKLLQDSGVKVVD